MPGVLSQDSLLPLHPRSSQIAIGRTTRGLFCLQFTGKQYPSFKGVQYMTAANTDDRMSRNIIAYLCCIWRINSTTICDDSPKEKREWCCWPGRANRSRYWSSHSRNRGVRVEMLDRKTENQHGRRSLYLFIRSIADRLRNQNDEVLGQSGLQSIDVQSHSPSPSAPTHHYLHFNSVDVHNHNYAAPQPPAFSTRPEVMVQENRGGPPLPYPTPALLRPTGPVRSMSVTTLSPSIQQPELSYTKTAENRQIDTDMRPYLEH